ncbi:MAG: winged helix-turn-helix domain-containing protein [bacterium]|jgi:uncharacterized protein YcaQ
MSRTLKLTRREARRVLLAQQGLLPPRALAGKAGIINYIRRVGCIQFDPLNIIGRSPEIVLQARVGDFRPAMLAELLYQDRALLDGWDKMMAIYRTEDWPYFRRQRDTARQRYGGENKPVTDVLPLVRREVAERGPLSSLDLEMNTMVDWGWAPTRIARAALESMYFWGELIVHHKVNNRKVYDFAARELPPELLAAPDPNETEAEYQDWRILRRLGGVGLLWGKGGDAWLGLREIKSRERNAAIDRLKERGKVMEAAVEGIGMPLYLRGEDWPHLERALSGETEKKAALLAPLDNLIWDRQLTAALFDFDYRWEVYKPAIERRYGYYVLPVLYGDRFVARCEPVLEKKNRVLRLRNWWWEPGTEKTEELREALAECFRSFLGFCGAAELRAEGGTGMKWLEKQI